MSLPETLPDGFHQWPDHAQAQWLSMELTRAAMFEHVAAEIGVQWDAARQSDPRLRKRELARLMVVLSRVPAPYLWTE